MAKSRLQFRHYEGIFDTRVNAIEFLDAIVNSNDNRSLRLKESLYGEPIVVKYKDNVVVDEEGNETYDQRIILAIGVEGHREEGVLDIKYHYIDSANIEKNIEELFEKVDGLDEFIQNIIKAVGLNEDGTYSPVEKGNYINKAKSVKAATKLLDSAIKAVQDELDNTQKGAGLNEDGSYEHVHNHVDDPYEYISKDNVDSLYEADKALDKGIQELKADSIRNVIVNHGKEDYHVEEVIGVLKERVAYLDITTTNLRLPSDYEKSYREPEFEKEDHQIHDNMQLSEVIARLEHLFNVSLDETAAVHIEKVPQEELEANVREAYKLVNSRGHEQKDSERIYIYKDSALKFVYLGHTGDHLLSPDSDEVIYGEGNDSLNFIYYTVDGIYIMRNIDLGSFLRESEFKDGLWVNANGEVRVKIDETSEVIASGTSANMPYLTVSERGVKIDGIQYSIDNTVNEEKDRAIAAETSLSGSVDTVIANVGLKEDGTYNKHLAVDGFSYINSANTVDEATQILDKALQDEVRRSEGAEKDLQSEIDAVEYGLGFTENGQYVNEKSPKFCILGETVVGDINELDNAAYKLDDELTNTQKGAGLAEDGSYIPYNVAPDVANYISGATSLNEADKILDENLKAESDRAINEETNLKSWVGYSGNSGYIADETAHFISGATDLYNADQLLDSKINQIAEERQLVYEGIIKGAGLTYDASGAVIYDKHNKVEDGVQFISSADSIDQATVILDQTAQTIISGTGLNPDGTFTPSENTHFISSASSVVNALEIIDGNLNDVDGKVENIIKAAGFAEDGSYTANTGSNYLIEATSLVDADNKLDNAIKSEVDRATEAERVLTENLAALSAETLSNHVVSTGETINVTKLTDYTNIEVNIDNATLKQNDSNKIATTLFIDKVANVGENVRETYQLKDGNGNIWGSRIEIYKDQTLKNVELKGQILEFTYILADGSETTVGVDMSAFLYEGEFKDGLITEGSVVKIRLADGNEKFLTVDENGLKLSGVQAAIDAAQASATTVVVGNNLVHIGIEEQIASDGHKVYVITESNIADKDKLDEVESNLNSLSGSVVAMDIAHTVSSADGSINVTKTTDGTDVNVNVDGTTIVKGDGGALSTTLNIKQNVLESTATYSTSYSLYDNSDNKKGVDVVIPTAVKRLNSIQINDNSGDQKLVLSHYMTNDLEETNPVVTSFDVDSIIGESDISSGLTVVHVEQYDNSGNTIQAGYVQVKIHPDSEFITVTEEGVKVTGISDAINTAKTVVKKGTESDHVTVIEEVASDGHSIYTINDKDIASNAELKTEIEQRTKDVADLNEKVLNETNRAKDAERDLAGRIAEETTRAQLAEAALESKITTEISKETAAREAADKVLESLISQEATNRETNDKLLKSDIESEAQARDAADKELERKLKEETERANEADSKLQEEIDRIEGSVGLEPDGSIKWDSHTGHFNSGATVKEAVESLDESLTDLENYLKGEGGIDEQFSDLQDELDRTQVGAGLQDDGTYKPHNSSPDDLANYIDKAKSLDEADTILDAELKKTNDSLKELEDFVKGEGGIDDKFNDFEETVNGQFKDLQEELDRTQNGAGLNEDGSYKPHNRWPDDIANYISGATSLNEADKILDDEIKKTNDELANTQKGVGLDEDGNYIPNPDNEYTSGSTTVAGAIDDLNSALKKEIERLESEITSLNDRIEALETANTNITETIFNAVADMLRGTSREIKVTKDVEKQTIAIGFQDNAIFGNLLYNENNDNPTVGGGDHNDVDPDEQHCDPLTKDEIQEILANEIY